MFARGCIWKYRSHYENLFTIGYFYLEKFYGSYIPAFCSRAEEKILILITTPALKR